jgi:hypothetical protein
METINLRAHFDGSQIRLDEPFELEPNTRLIITVLLPGEDKDRAGWLRISESGIAPAYGEEEPDYSPEMIRESNGEYETG